MFILFVVPLRRFFFLNCKIPLQSCYSCVFRARKNVQNASDNFKNPEGIRLLNSKKFPPCLTRCKSAGGVSHFDILEVVYIRDFFQSDVGSAQKKNMKAAFNDWRPIASAYPKMKDRAGSLAIALFSAF